MTSPIVGSLGGNALRVFRVEIDYVKGVTYLEKHASVNRYDSDVAGIVVHAEPDGDYTISGVAKKGGRAVVNDIKAGDRLLRVDNFDVTGASLADVLRALRGQPGQTKILVLDRMGKQVTVRMRVTRLP